MQEPLSRRSVAARRVGWSAVGAVLAGAAMGSVSGSVTACEFSAALGWEVGGCGPTGVAWGALGGALLGLVAAPLGRFGRRRRLPAAHRPAGSTWAAAGLVVAALAAAVWVWTSEWGATEGGLERFPLFVAGLGIGGGGVVLLVAAWGLLRRRGWARWGMVVGFSLAAVAALSALLAALAALQVGVSGNPWLNQPLPELVPPVVVLLLSVAVVVLLLWPSTARDFAASGQAPQQDEGPRQQRRTP
jgi:hypothetical protein